MLEQKLLLSSRFTLPMVALIGKHRFLNFNRFTTCPLFCSSIFKALQQGGDGLSHDPQTATISDITPKQRRELVEILTRAVAEGDESGAFGLFDIFKTGAKIIGSLIGGGYVPPCIISSSVLIHFITQR